MARFHMSFKCSTLLFISYFIDFVRMKFTSNVAKLITKHCLKAQWCVFMYVSFAIINIVYGRNFT